MDSNYTYQEKYHNYIRSKICNGNTLSEEILKSLACSFVKNNTKESVPVAVPLELELSVVDTKKKISNKFSFKKKPMKSFKSKSRPNTYWLVFGKNDYNVLYSNLVYCNNKDEAIIIYLVHSGDKYDKSDYDAIPVNLLTINSMNVSS